MYYVSVLFVHVHMYYVSVLFVHVHMYYHRSRSITKLKQT